MSGVIIPRQLYVTMMWTGTTVTSYIYSNLICKITAIYIEQQCQLTLFTITTETRQIVTGGLLFLACKWLSGNSADFSMVMTNIRSQSKKEPIIWNSASVSRRRMLATVVLCSGYFKLYFHTSHITPLHVVIELRVLEWTCVYCPRRFFASWKMKDLEEQRVCVKFCFKLGKTFTETFQM